MEVGERIRHMRIARGMTQQAVAQAAGMSEKQVRVIEAGEASPRVDNLLCIATALRCDPADLVGDPRDLAPDEAEVVAIMRRVSDDQRQLLVRQARVFDGAMTAAS